MPSIITHDTFGQDIYRDLFTSIGGSRDEAEAFLLGNQGPDPLFYSVACPWLRANHDLGNVMHDQLPARLIDSTSFRSCTCTWRWRCTAARCRWTCSATACARCGWDSARSTRQAG